MTTPCWPGWLSAVIACVALHACGGDTDDSATSASAEPAARTGDGPGFDPTGGQAPPAANLLRWDPPNGSDGNFYPVGTQGFGWQNHTELVTCIHYVDDIAGNRIRVSPPGAIEILFTQNAGFTVSYDGESFEFPSAERFRTAGITTEGSYYMQPIAGSDGIEAYRVNGQYNFIDRRIEITKDYRFVSATGVRHNPNTPPLRVGVYCTPRSS